MKNIKNILKEAGVLLIALFMVLSTVIVTVNAVCPDNCPDGMISYWKFNEGSGSIASDCYDGNDGTVSGATWTVGKVDGALDFNGTTDYVEVPDSTNLNLGTGDFTFEAWIKAQASQTDYPAIIAKRESDDPGDGGFLFGLWSNGCLHIQIGGINNNPGNTVLTDDNWYHVAATRSGTAVTYYVNGMSDGVEVAGNDASAIGHNLRIGRDDKSPSTTPFNGLIDEVAVYDRALHVSELLNHYKAGLDNRGYCNITFMGLIVTSLGDAFLGINDDMRVYNLDNDSDDGVGVNVESYNSYTCTIKDALQSDESFIMAKFSGTYDGESYWMSTYLGNGSQISGKGVYPVGFDGAASGAPSIIGWDEDCEGDDVIVFYEEVEALGPMGTITVDGGKGVYPVGFDGAASGAPSIIVKDPVCNDSVTWIWNCPELEVDNLEITRLMVRMGNPNEPLDGLLEDVSIYAAYMEEVTMSEHYAYELDPPVEPGIDGPNSGKPGTAYTYSFTNDGMEDVYFFVDWDDGSEQDVTELTVPGGTTSLMHTWSNEGTYTIKARAMNTYGMMSDSAEYTVTMPRNKAIQNTMFLQFLQNHPNMFPLLQRLLQRLGLQ